MEPIVGLGLKILVELLPSKKSKSRFNLIPPPKLNTLPIRCLTNVDSNISISSNCLQAAVMMIAHIKELNSFWRNEFKIHELKPDYQKRDFKARLFVSAFRAFIEDVLNING
jgi:hypothetical protein